MKRFFGSLLFFIALALFLAFLFLLFAKSENIDAVPLVDEMDTTAKVIGIALTVIAMVIAIMILVRAGRGRDTEDEEMFYIPESDRMHLAYGMDDRPDDEDEDFAAGLDIEVYNLATVSRQVHAWGPAEQKKRVYPYYFPRSVEKALYANDYIPIDHDGRKIKLRTLIAGPKGAQREPLGPPPRRIHVDYLKKQEEEKRLAEEAEALQDVEPGDGEAFMEALEERAGQEPMEEDEAHEEVYYGYSGDITPVERVEGIDAADARLLREAGVETTARLLFEDPAALAGRLGVDRAEVTRWQAIAELTKVPGIGPSTAAALAAAGVRGIGDLKRRSAAAIADDVNDHVEAHGGTRVSARRVEGWQEAAKDLRRTRQRIPAA